MRFWSSGDFQLGGKDSEQNDTKALDNYSRGKDCVRENKRGGCESLQQADQTLELMLESSEGEAAGLRRGRGEVSLGEGSTQCRALAQGRNCWGKAVWLGPGAFGALGWNARGHTGAGQGF